MIHLQGNGAMGMDAIEVRLARLEGAYEQIDRRLGTIEDRLVRLETKVDAGFARADARMDALAERVNVRIDELERRLTSPAWLHCGQHTAV